jgi:hypothetical protein
MTTLKQTSSSSDRRGNGGDVPPPSSNGATEPKQASIFDDIEALKRETAAKLSGRHTADGDPELVLGKPRKTWIFRTDGTQLFTGAVWEDPDTQITYFVAPRLWDLDDFDGALKPVIFVPYVTAAIDTPAIHGVWPVSTTPGNSYCDSAQEPLEKSRHMWIRMWSNNIKKIYRWKPSEQDYGEPKFLDKPIFEQLRVLFKDKRELIDVNHSVIQRLRGRKQA